MHTHYTVVTYMPTLYHENTNPWGHEINHFGRFFHVNNNFTLNLSDLCLGVEKKILKDSQWSLLLRT